MKYTLAAIYAKFILPVLGAVIFAFTFITNPTPPDTDTASVRHVKTYALTDAYITGQGYDSYGEYYYSSGAITAVYAAGIAKIDKDSGRIIAANYFALPKDFKDRGYDHIGDISVQNGVIYAPVEDRNEETPLVALYSADTLEYTGICYELDRPELDDGIPWCATDENYFYTSAFHATDEILVFNLSDMSYSHTVRLTREIARNQAGDVLDGTLYMNCDPHEGNKEVYSIDLMTGQTDLLFDRATTGRTGTEAEGLCAFKGSDDKVHFRIVDYNKLVSSIVREYTPK